MSAFGDQLLVQISDPAKLVELLAPVGDAAHTRLLALIDAAFALESAAIHDVRDVKVLQVEAERPILPVRRTQGRWTRSEPGYERTDMVQERPDLARPVWVDLVATVRLTLVLEVDRGEVAAIVDREITKVTSLEDFRSRFAFLNLGMFLDELGISTLEELKERHRHLLTEFRLKAPPPFNVADPANQRAFTLGVAVLIRDTMDVVAALRDAKFARLVMERGLTFPHAVDGAEVRTPYAPLLLLPEAALAATPFTASGLQQFFAAEGILALFVTPA